MAIADLLPDASMDQENLLDMLSLLQVDINLENTNKWKTKVYDKLLANCLKILSNRNANEIDKWQRLQQYLQGNLRSRIRLTTGAATENFEVELALRNWITKEFADSSYWVRKLDIIFNHDNDVEKMIALNKLTFRLYCTQKKLNFESAVLRPHSQTLDQDIFDIELSILNTLSSYFDDTISNR